ncbi:AMIN-like domain-containing (lipo)protein [Streptomonospora alba]|uniref:AMIN-like domain-containing (lipo)protein n=1 Tax=Streptomonospora alba TaxID=183763 RepID=UPI00069AF359|nr:hypothetical protein [Streptomonospora alba]
MRILAALGAAALVLPLASCGGGDGPESPDGTGTVETPRSPTPGTATQTGTSTAGDAPADGAGGGDDGAASPTCGTTENWTLRPDVREGNSGDPITDVRAGRHDCFDRVVLDIGGTAETGFRAEYRPEVQEPGSGRPVPVAGGAALKLIVYSPARGTPGGGMDEEPLAKAREHLVPESELASWDALRSVRYAGSFEAVTTIAVGAREKLPFRVFSRADEDEGVRTVVLDVAHSPG